MPKFDHWGCCIPHTPSNFTPVGNDAGIISKSYQLLKAKNQNLKTSVVVRTLLSIGLTDVELTHTRS